MTDAAVDDPHIATLQGTLHSYALDPRGTGYTVKFYIDIDQGESVLALNQALQKVITLRVERHRRARYNVPAHGRRSFMGSDDDA